MIFDLGSTICNLEDLDKIPKDARLPVRGKDAHGKRFQDTNRALPPGNESRMRAIGNFRHKQKQRLVQRRIQDADGPDAKEAEDADRPAAKKTKPAAPVPRTRLHSRPGESESV